MAYKQIVLHMTSLGKTPEQIALLLNIPFVKGHSFLEKEVRA